MPRIAPAARKSGKTEETEAPKPKTISEAEITRFHIDKQRYEEAKKVVASLEKDVKKQETDLIARIEGGAKVDVKSFIVNIDRSFKRRVVAWKDEFVKLLGQAKADEVTEATAETVYPKLVITAKE